MQDIRSKEQSAGGLLYQEQTTVKYMLLKRSVLYVHQNVDYSKGVPNVNSSTVLSVIRSFLGVRNAGMYTMKNWTAVISERYKKV